MTYFKNHIDAMSPYVPGEQPEGPGRIIKLNTNENPYPASPQVMAALREVSTDALRLYPNPMARRFCVAAAKVLGVAPEYILPGNGSDDLIMMIARACLGPERRVVYPVPTFSFYETQALIQDAERIEVPLDEEFHLPVTDLIAADGAVTFVANPNSPTGTWATTDELRTLAAGLKGLLVIDEAYVDFAEDSAVALTEEFDNVVVLRTLSKGYSLAALRLGFAVAGSRVLAGLAKTKAIFNVGAVACAAGAAAMADQDHKNANAERVKASRGRLGGQLEALGFRLWPSQANFLLAAVPGGDSAGLCRRLKERGILVRYYQQARLTDKLRITIGTDDQNAALVEALKEDLSA